jgi:LysR family nod box-dependent transcriptional activator
MRFKKLDLNLLVTLDALLTERSISRAGEKLFLSQSATSNALARLREYFDDELLVQVGRRMELTPRAESLCEPVRDVLVRLEATIAVQPDFDATATDREFRIFVSDFTMVTLVPHLLALAQQQRATARLHFLQQFNQPARALERGEADLLVIPRAYCSEEHPVDTLFEERFVCTVWNQGRHAQRPLTFDDYVAASHVAVQPAGNEQPAYEGWFMQRYGVARRVDVTTYSFAALPALVVGTDRVATVHERLLKNFGAGLPLVQHPLPMPMPPMEQGLQWHKYRSKDPGLTWLRALMHQAVQRMDA